METHNREFDIVIWGATGFVGRLVADHLTGEYTPAELTVALGGRNETALEDLAHRLSTDHEDWDDIPIILGDATDKASLNDLAERTTVVCTTVGPYTKYGTPLVEACIDAGTDYCDLTGEITWIREMIDLYHDKAVEADVRIVHSCGFDSIPADLGTKLVQTHAIDEYDTPCELVRIYVEDGEGGVSGGTLASVLAMVEATESDPLARQTLKNPYSLAPAGQRDGVDTGEQRGVRRDPLRSQWTAPSPMAAVNERIIRRSNALLGYPWGQEFRCKEVLPTNSGVGGAFAAGGIAVGIGVGMAALSVGFVRSGLERFVFPAPGEGPTQEEIKSGHFTVSVIGRGTTPDGPFTVECEIGADQDPGYGATSKMLGEAAMCLSQEKTESTLSGGILTPASGIGDPLAERLRAVGLTVRVGDQSNI